MPLYHPDDRLDQGVAEQVGLQSQGKQGLMLGEVEMLLLFNARIGKVRDCRFEAMLLARVGHPFGELLDRELFGELVEDPVLADVGRVLKRDPDACHGIANIEEPAGLATFAVDRKRQADGSLGAEAVQYRAPYGVVVKTGCEDRVVADFAGARAVDHPLVEVGGADAPDPAGELNVGAVVDFREVVEAAWNLGKGQGVGASLVLDGDKPFLDRDVGCPVFAHGAKLDQVGLGRAIVHREQKVQGPDHVVVLGEHRPLAVDHRERGAALLGEVDDGVGPGLR